MIELVSFVQPIHADSEEWRGILGLAQRLLAALNDPSTLASIEAANKPRGSSAAVQAAFRPSAETLGFQSEKKGLFSDSIPGLRPDYFLHLAGTGIILEVERGKTTTNNMDLLDFWKCHISGVAHYLFLLVPQELRHNDGMAPKKEFQSVTRRLGQFFQEGKYTNVRGLCIFGY